MYWLNFYLAYSVTLQKNVSAPGDVMEFTIEALDQSGNSRDGIWRVEDEEVMEVTHVSSSQD